MNSRWRNNKNELMAHTTLILPGLYNSGDGHWQTRWEAILPGARRVQQRNWDKPDRADWVAMLDAEIAAESSPVLLVAHSLGCALTAWWAAVHRDAPHAAKVKGALLVAPPDVERVAFRELATGFAPMPRIALPFRSIVVASMDDPWCALPRARSWATDWRAQFNEIGPYGHINGDSGLGDWPQGRCWLQELGETAV